ncbi:MAG: DNA-binding protein [Acidimicrobiales bacterium]|nr:MAG: DNA-binding protein [Acidimicrobiales bacterium]
MGESATADDAKAEFLVEPFHEGSPGVHVQAAIAAFDDRGLNVELGPFSSVASGDVEALADASRDMIINAISSGATSVRLQIGAPGVDLSIGTLHDALQEMIRSAEREIGSDSASWSREEKQRVVRMLDERGAFLLRGAVDDIAEVMGVSRITIYNYLNAIEASAE